MSNKSDNFDDEFKQLSEQNIPNLDPATLDVEPNSETKDKGQITQAEIIKQPEVGQTNSPKAEKEKAKKSKNNNPTNNKSSTVRLILLILVALFLCVGFNVVTFLIVEKGVQEEIKKIKNEVAITDVNLTDLESQQKMLHETLLALSSQIEKIENLANNNEVDKINDDIKEIKGKLLELSISKNDLFEITRYNKSETNNLRELVGVSTKRLDKSIVTQFTLKEDIDNLKTSIAGLSSGINKTIAIAKREAQQQTKTVTIFEGYWLSSIDIWGGINKLTLEDKKGNLIFATEGDIIKGEWVVKQIDRENKGVTLTNGNKSVYLRKRA